MIKYCLLFLLAIFSFCAIAQEQNKVTGKVIDKLTKEPLPFVSIGVLGQKKGTLTDENGKFIIFINKKTDTLVVSYVGYHKLLYKVKQINLQHVTIELEDQSELFGEVLIKPKENPALRIINAAVKNRAKNNQENLTAFQYKNYSKTTIALINISDKLKESWFFKPLSDVLRQENLMVNEQGKKILPAYVSEVSSDVYYIKNPQRQKEIILAAKQSGFGIEEDSYISDIMGTILSGHNLNNNYATLLGKNFISPIADGCHNFYVFTLQDTNYLYNQTKCFKIRVDLKQPKDLGYTGTIYIADGSFALAKANLTISKESNINFVNSIKINQLLEPTIAGPWFLKESEIEIEFDELEKNTSGFVANFKNYFSNLEVNQPKPASFFDYTIERSNDYAEVDENYWHNARTKELSTYDKQLYHQVDSIKNLPIIQKYADWGHTLLEGFKRIGFVELGPYSLLASANHVEGFRARLGFKTNQFLSKNYIVKGFAAYGFKDQKPKYGLGIDYIINHKKWQVISVNYRNDYDVLGISGNGPFSTIFNNNYFQALNFLSPRIRLNQTKEISISFCANINNNISYKVFYNNQYFKPLGNFLFAYYEDPENNQNNTKNTFTNTSIGLEVRWAYKEINISRGVNRVRVEQAKLPEVVVRYERGDKMLNGNFNYDKFQIALKYRMNTGVLGWSNWWAYGGKIFGRLPYPLLDVARGNQSIIYNEVNYSLMNFYEFVSDVFIHTSYTQHFEGLFTNRVPLLKKLDWRTLVIVKMAYGQLSDNNLLLIAKKDGSNKPIMQVHSFGNMPYTEVGYGFENIFHFFQLTAFHRLNHINLPDCRRFGLNLGLKIQF